MLVGGAFAIVNGTKTNYGMARQADGSLDSSFQHITGGYSFDSSEQLRVIELGFKIERSTNGKPFKGIAIVGAEITTFTNAGLSPGKTYAYRVRAYNATGDSAYLNTATAKTGPQWIC